MFCPRKLGNCHRQRKALTLIRDFNALRSSNHVDGIYIPSNWVHRLSRNNFPGTARKVSFSVNCSARVGIRLDAQLIVDRVRDPLPGAKVPFRGLD
jgi:hypothetical protein